jgi:hypothetical protein
VFCQIVHLDALPPKSPPPAGKKFGCDEATTTFANTVESKSAAP